MQRVTEVSTAKDTKKWGGDQGKHGVKTVRNQSKRTMDEIKEWQAPNYRTTVCNYLMLHNVAFSFSEESGLVFTAPDFFVKNMRYSLKVSYGCDKIKINELK